MPDFSSSAAPDSDSEPASRRRSRLRGVALCAIAIATLAGCATSRPAPRGETAAAPTVAGAETTTTAEATAATTAHAATAAATAPSAPAPMPAPAPAIRPLETFEVVWTTVRDQHFDKTLNGVDWDAVRAEFEPKVRAASSQDALRGLLSEMLARLGQSHFGVIPADEADASPTVETQQELADPMAAAPETRDAQTDAAAEPTPAPAADSSGGPGIAGLDVALVEGVPTVTRVTPGLSAARAGVLVGWQVVSVDGRDVDGMLAPLRESIARESDPDSPHARQLRMVLSSMSSQLVSGEAGERTRIVFRDASDSEQEVTIAFEPAPLGSSQFGNLDPFPVEVDARVIELPVDGGKPVKVGYLAFNIWMTGASEAIDKGVDLIRGCDGVVIDLRGNPGGIGAMATGLAGHFVNEPISLGSMIGRDTTLSFNVTPRKVSAASKRVRPISKPLAIVLDGRSASTSEVFAGGLQAVGRARIFGEASAGMALPARALELPNGDVLLHAVADFTTSNGTRLEGKGVIPDTAASLTRAGLVRGRDEVFDSAAAWIRELTLAARAAKPAGSTAPAPKASSSSAPTPQSSSTPRQRAAARAAANAARAAVADGAPGRVAEGQELAPR